MMPKTMKSRSWRQDHDVKIMMLRSWRQDHDAKIYWHNGLRLFSIFSSFPSDVPFSRAFLHPFPWGLTLPIPGSFPFFPQVSFPQIWVSSDLSPGCYPSLTRGFLVDSFPTFLPPFSLYWSISEGPFPTLPRGWPLPKFLNFFLPIWGYFSPILGFPPLFPWKLYPFSRGFFSSIPGLQKSSIWRHF